MAYFEHGGNIYEAARSLQVDLQEIIDFSANINPLGVPASFREALLNRWDSIKNYPDPDYTGLVKTIAAEEGVEEKNITAGNGATEVIYEIIRVLKPKKSLILAPTFSEYERALNRVNCDMEYFYLKEENNFQIDVTLLNSINESIDLVILCNPNNPTSQLTDRGLMRDILELCREKSTALMVDESFIDFVNQPENETLVPYIGHYRNLYIIKSLTKFFAIPGLRIGYGVSSNEGILKKIKEEKQPWTINSFAALAGETVLKDMDYIKKSREWMKKERDFLFRRLREIDGIKVYSPKANYILFKVLREEKDIKSHLFENKVLIRSCCNYKNLTESFFRAAVKDRVSNEYFVKILKEVLYES